MIFSLAGKIWSVMIDIAVLISRVEQIKHGFKDILAAAAEVEAELPPEEARRVAFLLFSHESYQVRALAVFILGAYAATEVEVLCFLREEVSCDPSWQVQEILAKVFDRYCAETGYQQALPVIREWLADPQANVRRAVTEGLRIWTGREYFREYPEAAISLLAALKEDDSEYVRKSVGNALRDISKKHSELIRQELEGWDISHKRLEQVYRLAVRWLDKNS